MIKLIKYEFLGRFKYILGFCAALITFNAFLLMMINSWQSEIILVLSLLAGFSMFIIALASGIHLYKKDLYGDTGYLIFTIPQSGYSIIASKLIMSLIEFIIYLLLSSMLSFVILLSLPQEELLQILIRKMPLGSVGFFILPAIGYLIALIIGYFSLSISKAVFSTKKLNRALPFAVFIISLVLIRIVAYYIGILFPQTVIFNIMTIKGRLENISLTVPKITLNIISVIYYLIVYVGMFIGASYVLEKKVDL